MDEQLYKAFQEEMNALEHFRLSYSLAHPAVSLERDDPDVRRLIEAMAFFGARSRLAAENHGLAMQRRLFRQFFDYLLSPLPVMGLLQARPTGQFADSQTLPRGSQFLIQTGDGRKGYVRLLADLRILPLRMTGCTTLYRPDRGFRLLLRLDALHAGNDKLGVLSLYISHLNDFKGSLGVHHALQKHMLRAAVVYDGEVNESTRGLPCKVSFGIPPQAPDEAGEDELNHPLEQERLCIHCPRQELFVHIEMPPAPGSWTTLTLCLDLDAHWPRELVLNRDIFQLFVVPIANLKRDFAQAITCKGTQERHALLHPQPDLGYVLHSVRGVYELSKQGMEPLLPGIFFGGNGSYEMDQSQRGKQLISWLALTFPEAFTRSRRIMVDAIWHQPWLAAAMHRGSRIVPFSRQTTGVDWELIGELIPHRDNDFLRHHDGFIQLLTLMNKSILSLEDIRVLLSAAGMISDGYYGEAMNMLVDVQCQLSPRRTGRSGTMVKQVYRFVFQEQGDVWQPLLASFTRHAERILDAWGADRVVEVETATSAVTEAGQMKK